MLRLIATNGASTGDSSTGSSATDSSSGSGGSVGCLISGERVSRRGAGSPWRAVGEAPRRRGEEGSEGFLYAGSGAESIAFNSATGVMGRATSTTTGLNRGSLRLIGSARLARLMLRATLDKLATGLEALRGGGIHSCLLSRSR